MRRRLVVVGLATTLLIVISLIVPLALLVRRQASDRARVDAEREARAAAALVALAVTVEPESGAFDAIEQSLGEGVIVVREDGTVLGEALEGQGSLVEEASRRSATITSLVDAGWEIALPVIGPDETVVVDAFATNEQLTEGVWAAWAWLLLLGVLLVGIAIWVADWLGRRLVVPVRDLEAIAHVMSEGDLDVRVDVESMENVPEEIVELGRAFNVLAERLRQLLREERESVADLSHSLRTPLTSLRLSGERLSNPEERRETLAQVDRMEEAVDRLIEQSRADRPPAPAICRIDEVVGERTAFWRVLADEQQRDFDVRLGASEAELGLARDELAMVVDALIGNVFDHTPPGTAMQVRTGEHLNRLWVELADRGPGIPDEAVVARGESGSGSTGLGLDIARRVAERTGGGIELANRDGGGAIVRVWFG